MSSVRHSLDPIFHPRSVAVLGASATPGSVGSILMRNLLANPFGGVVYPINPKRQSVHGVLCYPDLAAVPEAVDLAVIATPAATVPGLIAAMRRARRPGGDHHLGGLFRTGGRRAATGETRSAKSPEARCASSGPTAWASSTRRATSTPASPPTWPDPARSPCSASAGPSAPRSSTGRRRSTLGFSSFVSVGAMLDVDFADLIDYFADDPHTQSIVLYMESIGDVRKFLSAARSVSRTKQVIVVKSGRHEAGARAAASHTGALAGSDAVFDAAFRRAGVLRVTTIPDLFNMAEILAMQPQPRRPGPGHHHQRRRPRRHGHRRPDDSAAASWPRLSRRRWPPSTPRCRRSGATPTRSTFSATPRRTLPAWRSRSAPRTRTFRACWSC